MWLKLMYWIWIRWSVMATTYNLIHFDCFINIACNPDPLEEPFMRIWWSRMNLQFGILNKEYTTKFNFPKCENNLFEEDSFNYVNKLSNKNIKIHTKTLRFLFNIQMLIQNISYGYF